MVALLTQCCCGCTLRTGTIIIAVLTLVATSIYLASNFVDLQDVSEGFYDMGMNETIDHDIITFLRDNPWVILMDIVSSCVELFVTMAMLGGTIMDKSVFLMVWIIYEVLLVTVNVVEDMVYVVYYAVIGEPKWSASALAIMVQEVVLYGYFIYVVYSHYQTLRLDAKRRQQTVEDGNTVQYEKHQNQTTVYF